METLKRILKWTFFIAGVYMLHIMIEVLIVNNVVAYLGYHIPVFVV